MLGPLATEVQAVTSVRCGCWESNSGPFQEQYLYVTAESSPQLFVDTSFIPPLSSSGHGALRKPVLSGWEWKKGVCGSGLCVIVPCGSGRREKLLEIAFQERKPGGVWGNMCAV